MAVDPLILATLAVGILLYGILRITEALAKWASRRNKVVGLSIDSDSKSIHIGLYEPRGNKIDRPATKTSPHRIYIMEGEEKYSVSGILGNFNGWMLQPRHGWNLKLTPKKVSTPDTWKAKVLSWIKREAPLEGYTAELLEAVRGETDKEALGTDINKHRLAAANPATYAFAIDHNEAEDTMTANDDTKNMWETLAPYMLIGLVVCILALGWIGYTVSKAASAAGATHGA